MAESPPTPLESPRVKPRAALASSWVPLGRPYFRAFWLAAVVSNLGTWMHRVGASWLMTQLAPSPLMVSLIQTTENVPFLVLALATGALADIVDRRRLLIFSHAWLVAAAGLLGFLTVLHRITPGWLLAFTFMLALGDVLLGPAWDAMVPEMVPNEEITAAISLDSVAFNVARAVGPALGGMIVALCGSGGVFLLNAASFVGIIWVLVSRGQPPYTSAKPSERLGPAMVNGLRFVRGSRAIRSILARTSLFAAGSIVLFSLLPLYVRQYMERGAGAYGALLGCFGLGGITGGLMLPHSLRARWLGKRRLLDGGVLLFATMLALLGTWNWYPLACLETYFCGFCWSSLLTTFNSSVQMNSPAWVRGRVLAFYQVAFSAIVFVFSAFWGWVAQHLGIRHAFLIASLTLGAAFVANFRFPVASDSE